MKIALLGLVMMSLMVACATVVGPDNVSFPTGYRKQTLIATVDRADNKQVRDIYVSAEAVKMARAGNRLPTGSVFTMEIDQAKADAKGDLAKDTNGRLVKGDMTAVFVMERRAGFGAGYPDELRNGE